MMNEKIKLIVATFGITLFFSLAAVGYNYLSKKYSPSPVLPNMPDSDIAESNTDNNSAGNQTTVDNGDGTSEDSYRQLQKAPDFYVYDKQGNKIEFGSQSGKPVIINFWATWCGPCKIEMPHFQKAYDELSDKIEFMMINPTDGINDTEKSVAKFLSDTGYTFPVYYDSDLSASSVYGINSFPNTFFIDKDGYLLGYYPGAMSEETLYACIDIVLGNS